MRNRVIVLMAVVLSSAYGLVSAYHVEPRTSGQSGWTRTVQPNHVVSQVVTMNFDELDSTQGGCYVELFSGGKCTEHGYGLSVTTYPGGTTVAYEYVTEAVEHGWVRFKLNIAYPESIVRGKKSEFTFRRSGPDFAA